MSRLENLPLDIIREIIGPQTEKADLCSLRLASKCLDMLIYPTLFSSLDLDFKDINDFTRCRNIVTMLANGSTSVFGCTQQLKLNASRIYDVNDTEMQGLSHIQKLVGEQIFDAISALNNLQTMNFYVSTKYPEQLSSEIMRALGTLTSFKGFSGLTLSKDPASSFTLEPLSNLTVL